MNKKFMKTFGTMAIALTFCLKMLFISSTSFAQRCVDNGDGTVTDNGTLLMWQKASAGPMDWVQAMRYASNLSLAGHSDWWLPSKDELWSMCYSCQSLMEVVSARYWSSTTYTNYTKYAYITDFNFCFGGSNLKSDSHYVRAVRPAQ